MSNTHIREVKLGGDANMIEKRSSSREEADHTYSDASSILNSSGSDTPVAEGPRSSDKVALVAAKSAVVAPLDLDSFSFGNPNQVVVLDALSCQ